MREVRPWPYEELVHIPMVIRHPDLEPQKISALVQNTDLTATALDFIGVKDKAQEEMHSQSLLPLLTGQKDRVRDFAISGYHNHSWAIYTEDWSYIHWLNEAEFKDNPMAALEFYGDLIKQMIPDLYQEGLKITGEDNIWSCTPGAKAEIPQNDELYDRKKDPFQLNNIITENKETANNLWIQLRDYMLKLKVS